jgi:HAD superfamily hydrolase (TIGR01509 family)
MTRPLGFRIVIFDVDGTLIDSNAAHAESWSQALREAGHDISSADVRPLVGMGGDKLLPKLIGIAEDSEKGKALGARKKELFATRLPTLAPTPGARELLTFLTNANIAIVVATSSDERDMHALLEQAGVADLIPDRASKDSASRSKPDPDIIAAALAEVDGRASEAVMVGDTPYDIEAADRARVPSIALRCGGFWPDAAFRGALEIWDHPGALLSAWQPQSTRP